MNTTTTAQAETPKAPPLEKQTTVGNYFVSNYPPFSFWKPEFMPEVYAAMERSPSTLNLQPSTTLGLYVHIPFCRKRCHFCYFKVYTDKDSSQIKAYIDAILNELSLYAAKPFIGGRKPNFIYFGGGTPSYLSVDQLRHLTGRMKSLLPWDESEEVTFECEPGTLTDHKLRAIRDIGVTRLSLGVENFDDHILEINGRAHHNKEIGRAYAFAREIGFPQINIDLIAGMVEETEANWRENIRKTIDLAPDSVADWATKRAWVNYGFTELEKAGYTVASAYTAVKDKAKTKFVYRDKLWAGADLLSVGVASFGYIGGVHYQNHTDFDPYVAQIQQGKVPIYRAQTPSDDERLIREFILQLKLGHLSLSYFRNKFGIEPATRFAEPLQRLKDWGFLAIKGDQVLLHRDGLLQVDRLLHEFFLPQHRTNRYV